MRSTGKYEMDMCTGPLFSKMLRFALPLMLSGMLQLVFNAADIAVVGRFVGDKALAAVGANSILVQLITNMTVGVSVGANVVAAKQQGAGDPAGQERAVHTAVLLAVFLGAVMTVFPILFSGRLLTILNTPADIFADALLYLRIYALGMIPTVLYNFGAALLRAVGDTKRPLYFLFLAGVVNVGLNLFFVLVCGLGVAGVALATILSQCISCVLVIGCLVRGTGSLKLEWKKLRPDRATALQILRIGLPAGIQSAIFNISNLVVQSAVNEYGAAVIAGNSAATSVGAFIYAAINSFYQATISFTGQNIGAGNYKRVLPIMLIGFACANVLGIALGQLALAFGEPLLGLYSTGTAVVEAGMVRMRAVNTFYFLCGAMDAVAASIRGMGYSLRPTFISLVGSCALRIIFVKTVYVLPRFHTLSGLYICYPVSWILTMAGYFVCFFILWRKLMRQGRAAI